MYTRMNAVYLLHKQTVINEWELLYQVMVETEWWHTLTHLIDEYWKWTSDDLNDKTILFHFEQLTIQVFSNLYEN